MSGNRWHTKRRGTPAEQARIRQYASPEHRAAVRAFRALIDAGRGYCCRCGKHLPPGSRFHADHNAARTGYLGPACPPCNVRAAASAGARKVNARRVMRSGLAARRAQ